MTKIIYLSDMASGIHHFFMADDLCLGSHNEENS